MSGLRPPKSMTSPVNQILCGDAAELMRGLPGASIHAIVTDPPYGLEFMGEEWDKFREEGKSKYFHRPDTETAKGFGAKDFGTPIKVLPRSPEGPALLVYQSWTTAWAREALRVLVPGASMLVMGGTRTYHRMACGVEDAGFEVKDTVLWCYNSGFPKAQDLGKMIDRRLGVEGKREIIGKYISPRQIEKGTFKDEFPSGTYEQSKNKVCYGEYAGKKERFDITIPATPLAREWDGWKVGGLKPSFEPIILAIKPVQVDAKLYIEVRNILFGICECLNSVAVADKGSLLSQVAQELSIALWSATNKVKLSKPISGHQQTTHSQESMAQTPQIGKAGDSSEGMDTLLSGLKETVTDLNTTSLWKNILAAALNQTRTFITETATALITDLRTLSFLLFRSTPTSTAGAGIRQDGSRHDVPTAGKCSTGESGSKPSTPKPSAQEAATANFTGLIRGTLASIVAKLSIVRGAETDPSLSFAQSSAGIDGSTKDGSEPNFRPVLWAVKPPEGPYVENVLRHGVGAIDVEACRIPIDENDKGDGVWGSSNITCKPTFCDSPTVHEFRSSKHDQGRYPANMVRTDRFGDGYDRFYFVPKADRGERDGGLEGMPEQMIWDLGHKDNPGRNVPKSGSPAKNIHPTVKPVRLMEHLIKLVTRRDQIVLDPFVGSGTTCIAARNLLRRYVGIDNNAEYCEIAKKRLAAIPPPLEAFA